MRSGESVPPPQESARLTKTAVEKRQSRFGCSGDVGRCIRGTSPQVGRLSGSLAGNQCIHWFIGMALARSLEQAESIDITIFILYLFHCSNEYSIKTILHSEYELCREMQSGFYVCILIENWGFHWFFGTEIPESLETQRFEPVPNILKREVRKDGNEKPAGE